MKISAKQFKQAMEATGLDPEDVAEALGVTVAQVLGFVKNGIEFEKWEELYLRIVGKVRDTDHLRVIQTALSNLPQLTLNDLTSRVNVKVMNLPKKDDEDEDDEVVGRLPIQYGLPRPFLPPPPMNPMVAHRRRSPWDAKREQLKK